MTLTQNATQVAVKIVGSSSYGRYDLINAERTYNMYISDEWLVNFPGYELQMQFNATPIIEGRGAFHSVRGDFFIVVIGNQVFKSTDAETISATIGNLDTSSGAVYIDENLASQIGIVDGSHLYIYNWSDNAFGKPSITETQIIAETLLPNYITYQNTHFILGNGIQNNTGSQWYVYFPSLVGGFQLDPTIRQLGNPYITLTLQTKPDFAKAALRIPGKGNALLVLGTSVAEIWQDVGSATIYQRNASVNIDYGCASVATIGSMDDYVAWLGINEKSSPSIMVMTGGGAQRLSTDGIDFLLETVNVPSDSMAMFFRKDGHVFYLLSFFNVLDNFSVVYDFTVGKFYDVTDFDFSYFPARSVIYFQGSTYFLSKKNGDLYKFGTDITVYSTNADDIYSIPRIRVCDTYRFPGPEKFRINNFTFTIENGTESGVNYIADCVGYLITEDTEVPIVTEDDIPILNEDGYCGLYKPRVDVTISKDGGLSYSSAVPYYMHKTAHYKNQPRFNQLGTGNLITVQMRFWGFWRFICSNGVLEISQ